MNILLEGVDAVGKDTFAEKLSLRLGYEILRGSSFEISELGSEGMFYYSMGLLNKDNIIMNRTFYSNLVYGKLYNYPMMSKEQYKSLVEKMNENSIIVYLHASPKTVKYRMGVRGDDMVKQDEVENILREYNNVMYGQFKPKVMMSINTNETDFKNEIELIKKIVK